MYFSKLILMRERLFTYVMNFFQNENEKEIKFNNRYFSNKNVYTRHQWPVLKIEFCSKALNFAIFTF